MKTRLILCVLVIAVTLSCSKSELVSEEVQDCSTVYCTYDLRWISVKLVDQSGEPVALDRMKVTRVSDGKDITRAHHSEEWSTFRRLGTYPIISDIDRGDIAQFKHTKLRYHGYNGNREVVKANYVVTFDCCHISLISGERELVVTP